MLKFRPASKSLLIGLGTLFSLGLIAAVSSLFSPAPSLDLRLEAADRLLSQARETHKIVAPSSSPGNLTSIEEDSDLTNPTAARKTLFLAELLPLVVMENERILKQRQFLQGNPSIAYLNALARDYGLKPGQVRREDLLPRVDTVPVSLVLAQAAIESGWGTSRFARQGNALFGERTYDPDIPGIAPHRATGFKVKSFMTPQLSVRSYMRTLNANRAYRGLRSARAQARAQGRNPSGRELALGLARYSELGKAYIDRIVATIEANGLSAFNGTRISSR